MKRFREFIKKRKAKKAQKQQPLQQQQTPASVQQPPQVTSIQAPAPSQHPVLSTQDATPGTLSIALRNDTSSSNVFAYITGQALDNNNAIFILQSDAITPYYPTSPSATGSALAADCAIPLGAPGNTVTATVPHIAGGRIWFAIDNQLTFLLNPGPALVEPSVNNPSDPNIAIDWVFCEFTFNTDQLYANISYVDFVGAPVALTLDTVNSGSQHVSGMAVGGLQQIADGLRAQAASDSQPWDQLIVNRSDGTPLRILSPNQGMVGNPSAFQSYYDDYVNQTYQHFATQALTVDTQAAAGIISSTLGGDPNVLVLGSESFAKPSTSDIFTCSTGPFATGSDATRNAIIPRLAAAFNRSTLLVADNIPADQSLYYQNAVTNHYSRVVHAANLDGKGYAFPYDDVQPTNGKDQSGEVHAGDPQLFTVAVGGSQASVTR